MVPPEAKSNILWYLTLLFVTLRDKPSVSFYQGVTGSRPVRPTKI
jgi:hypothetical protein